MGPNPPMGWFTPVSFRRVPPRPTARVFPSGLTAEHQSDSLSAGRPPRGTWAGGRPPRGGGGRGGALRGVLGVFFWSVNPQPEPAAPGGAATPRPPPTHTSAAGKADGNPPRRTSAPVLVSQRERWPPPYAAT